MSEVNQSLKFLETAELVHIVNNQVRELDRLERIASEDLPDDENAKLVEEIAAYKESVLIGQVEILHRTESCPVCESMAIEWHQAGRYDQNIYAECTQCGWNAEVA